MIQTPEKIGIESEIQEIKQIIRDSHYSSSTKRKLIQIFEQFGTEVFGNSKIVEALSCDFQGTNISEMRFRNSFIKFHFSLDF